MRRAAFSESWLSRPTRGSGPGLADLAGAQPFALLHGDGRHLVFGEGRLAVFDSMDVAGVELERHGELPPILPDFVGFLGYELGAEREPLAGRPREASFALPLCRFVLYRRVLVFDRALGRVWECERKTEGGGAIPEAAVAPGPETHRLGSGRFGARRTLDTDSPEGYAGKVEEIRSLIGRGEVYQVNLSRQEEWRHHGGLLEFAQRLLQANPAPFSAVLADPDFTVVSSSPERLARVQGGRIEAMPIKGTSPRGSSPSEDEALARGLLASAKDRAELAMIVDLLRNDLSKACVLPSVEVGDFPRIESYANVHHLVATVSGIAREGLDADRLLDAVFPGGSVTGCPKLAAMRAITRLEEAPRTVYTGSIGWFSLDFSMLDLNIAIRTVWSDGERLRLGLGGGIVWDSDPAAEYLETVHKGRSIVQCLSS